MFCLQWCDVCVFFTVSKNEKMLFAGVWMREWLCAVLKLLHYHTILVRAFLKDCKKECTYFNIKSIFIWHFHLHLRCYSIPFLFPFRMAFFGLYFILALSLFVARSVLSIFIANALKVKAFWLAKWWVCVQGVDVLLKLRDRVSATQIFKSIHCDAKTRIACDYDRAVLCVIIFWRKKRRENVQTMRNEQHNGKRKTRNR